MSYLEIKQKTKRIQVQIFQIDLDVNDPLFDSEFAADLSSYGTPKTTNDIRAFKEGSIKTYSFCNTHIFGIDCFPYLIKAMSEPAKVNPGEDIGIRATASVSLKDFQSTDSYELQGLYANRRVAASFWSKMFARNEFKFRDARILNGFTEDGRFYPENFETEHYIIDSYQGPSLEGTVSFSLVDVLALTDGINVKIPFVTTGILSSPVNINATSCTFNALDTAAEYGTSGFWIIGSNIMQYTITSPTSANIVQNRFGTEPEVNDTNSSIQKCIAWDNVNAIDIIKDIFALTKIPTSYVPTVKYDALKTGELSIFNFTAIIYDPTEAKQLLNEIIQHCGLTMYTDVVLKEITIVPSSVITTPIITFDCDEHIQKDSYSQSNVFEKLVTNQFIRWGLKNHTLNERTNYAKNKRAVDIVQEDASRLRIGVAGKDILSRWLANNLDGNQIADQIITKRVAQFSRIPRQVKFKTDISYIGNLLDDKRLWLGSTFQIKPPKTTNVTRNGSEELLVAQCTSLRSTGDGLWEITGLTYNANIPPKFDYVIKSGTYIDYILANDPEFAPKLSAGAKEYVVIVEQGSLFGASSTAIPSFRQGVFPAGATLYLIIYGRILGRGGDAGNGGLVSGDMGQCFAQVGEDGQNGGPALSLTTDAKIDVLYGLIAGGGGGSSGATARCPEGVPGDGGGGGQGFPGGAKGLAGDDISPIPDVGFDGTDGSTEAPGDANGFNRGGEFGQKGFSNLPAIGGEGGPSILTNGNNLNIISGNTSDKIKGVII